MFLISGSSLQFLLPKKLILHRNGLFTYFNLIYMSETGLAIGVLLLAACHEQALNYISVGDA